MRRIVAISQARINSQRLPEKVILAIDEADSMLSLHLKRLKKSKMIDEIVVATTFEDGAKKY